MEIKTPKILLLKHNEKHMIWSNTSYVNQIQSKTKPQCFFFNFLFLFNLLNIYVLEEKNKYKLSIIC